MEDIRRRARIAGLLYLVSCPPALISLVYVPRKLILPNNAAATSMNLLEHETLFRIGMVGELVAAVAFLFVVRALYRLFENVDRRQASLMVTLFALSVPISCWNVVNEVAALRLFKAADFVAVFAKPQRDALAMLFLRLHGYGLGAAAIFWGLWLFPFGILVIKSGFAPRVFGILLLVNGFAYPITTVTSLVLPAYLPLVSRVALVAETGELWIMLWLLFGAVRRPPAGAVAAPA